MVSTNVLRIAVGGLFAGHGAQKLFGWFQGHGLEGTTGFFEQLGLRPGRRNAIAAGATEAAGGALLAAGVAVPAAAAGLSATMLTAIRTVHGDKGPWATEGGYEYNLVLLAALAAITEERHGARAAAAQLAAGAIGSALVVEAGRRAARQPAVAPEPEAEAAPAPAPEPRFTREEQAAGVARS
ncbi:MAG TPA: DoxX family protein [Baekduia sp.]|nr:DoxX family protein [Baekduia sp.]